MNTTNKLYNNKWNQNNKRMLQINYLLKLKKKLGKIFRRRTIYDSLCISIKFQLLKWIRII